MQFHLYLIWAAEQLCYSFFLFYIYLFFITLPLWPFLIFPRGLNKALWLSKHNTTWSLQCNISSFKSHLVPQINMQINLRLIALLIMTEHYPFILCRLMFPSADGVPVVSVLHAAPDLLEACSFGFYGLCSSCCYHTCACCCSMSRMCQ